MSDFDIQKYREMFIEEAEELFESADSVLLEAEANGTLTDEEMGQLFRDVHTLKGSGASVELNYFAEFTHDVENLMDKLRNHEIEFQPEMAGTLIDALDVMKEILQLENSGEMDRDTFESMSRELLTTIQGYINGNSSNQTTQTQTQPKVENDTTLESINTNPLNKAYGFFGEDEIEQDNMISDNDFGFFDENVNLDEPIQTQPTQNTKQETKPQQTTTTNTQSTQTTQPTQTTQNQPVKKAPTKTPKDKAKKSSSANTIRVNLDKIDVLMNNVGDLVITNAMLTQFASSIQENKTRVAVLERLEQLERHIRDMQDSIMSIRMVPMESIYSKFPKVVRDISKKLEKKVEFRHVGDSVEIDKAMIEGLTDPLMHIIRNSLDHGIEKPEERIAKGKPEVGIIEITAEQANGQMIITITDDGRGIDGDKVAKKALENGIIDEYQLSQMSDNEKAMLIFAAGLSTAEEVTDISGRGVGMDVVKSNIQKLGGVIKLETEVGKGTVITIMLPLTLAILDGLDIAVGNMKYILPLSAIVESLQPTPEMIKKIGDGIQDLLMLREEFIPVVRLHQLFGIKPKFDKLEEGMLIVVKSGSQKIAIFIDEFLQQHQVVVKPIDKNFRAVEGIGAATVRGDGSIGLIIDVVGLIEVQKKMENGIIDIKSRYEELAS